MLSNSEYPEEFMVRLSSLEIMINETRKCFKLMQKIQTLIMKINPVLKLHVIKKNIYMIISYLNLNLKRIWTRFSLKIYILHSINNLKNTRNAWRP